MDGGTIVSLTASGVALVGLVAGWVKARDDARSAARDVEARIKRDEFAQNLDLREFIAAEVRSATEPLEQRIADLEERARTTKTIVRRYFQRLVFWDQSGRLGAMPLPSPADTRELDIEDLGPVVERG